MLYFWIVMLVINLVGFLNMGYDKHQAIKGRWRTPESRFFLFAVVGGAVGIYAGMKVWRHKTMHALFRWGIPFLLLVNLVGFYYVWFYFK